MELFEKLRFLVLDEADRLLDGQYSVEVSGFCKAQSLVFFST